MSVFALVFEDRFPSPKSDISPTGRLYVLETERKAAAATLRLALSLFSVSISLAIIVRSLSRMFSSLMISSTCSVNHYFDVHADTKCLCKNKETLDWREASFAK